MKLPLLLLVASLYSLNVLAARAPVEEIAVNPQNNSQQAKAQPLNQQQIEMFHQMQTLQEEVRQLRGLVEELGFHVDQLKQRQQDDYLDLDRRISTGSGNGAPTSNGDSNGQSSSQQGLPVAGDDEKQLYGKAQSLLKEKKFAEAIGAFENHISTYPKGKLLPNSYYWLGQIYMVKDDLDKAGEAFAQVVDNHPGSNKALDSAFKLGKVYHLQGKNDKARNLLEKVAAGSSEVSRQARDYIDTNLN